MGGFFAAQMKFAGYDAIIIEGKSATPVWINIKDEKVSIEKADFLWGKGTRATTEEICRITSPETCVAAIGQAGENLVPLSCMINSRNHSGGAGTGAVMGSKNLKAIAVEGTKGVNIADRKEMKRLNDYMMTELIGANNNHVVPSTPQAWQNTLRQTRAGRPVRDCSGARQKGDQSKPGKSRRVTRIPWVSVPINPCSIWGQPLRNTRSK